MKSEIEKIEKRPIQYWYEDGLNEMAFGIIGLSLGVYFWIRTRIPLGSAWHVPWALAMIPLLLIEIPLFNRMIGALKQKLTYPRTGFVSYKRPGGKRIKFSILGALVGGTTAIAYGLLRSDVFPEGTAISASPLVTGFILAAAFVWIGMKTGVFRFFVTAMISALAGIALALAGLAEMAALGAYWGILGASHCVSGAFVFVRYLRRHPATETDPS
jgi:hypothetical protein